jgi:hypothetical protein
MSTASKVATEKREHPERFCQESSGCLWRVVHRDGTLTPCRSTKHRHPTVPEETAAENEARIIGLMAALTASLAEGSV